MMMGINRSTRRLASFPHTINLISKYTMILNMISAPKSLGHQIGIPKKGEA